MREISIFAKPATYQKTVRLPKPHLVRASSIIRGEQIAAYLGCKLNPEEGFENDVCIHVKPSLMEDVKDGHYVDILDGEHFVNWIKPYPGVHAITFSDLTYERYRPWLNNKTVVIPQHHCNFDKETRIRDEVAVIGFIGGEIGFHFHEDDMRKIIEGNGFKFLFNTEYRTREEVVDFYKQVDIQIIWSSHKPHRQAKCPLKVINAASFGIPTAAYPQEAFREVDGCYVKAHTIGALVDGIRQLRDNRGLYEHYVGLGLSMADKYHISKIAELYRQLT